MPTGFAQRARHPGGRPLILAHAFGARYELPIPLVAFVVGGALVVLVSFLIVFNRRVTRAESAAADLADAAYVRPLHPVWGTASLLLLAFMCVCGFVGSQETAENIIDTFFWIVIW